MLVTDSTKVTHHFLEKKIGRTFSIRIEDKSAISKVKQLPPQKKLSLGKSLKRKALNKKITDGKGRGRGGETSVLVFYFNQGHFACFHSTCEGETRLIQFYPQNKEHL